MKGDQSYRHDHYHWYSCHCLEGYQGNGFKCDRIPLDDDCETQSHHCSKKATCKSKPKKQWTWDGTNYNCMCKDGYEGNGFSCEKIDNNPCTNGLHECSRNAVCDYDGYSITDDGIVREEKQNYRHFEHHWYTCYCMDGFVGDGFDCTQPPPAVDECKTGTHKCSGKATCTSQPAVDLYAHALPYACTCNSGYTGNGYS